MAGQFGRPCSYAIAKLVENAGMFLDTRKIFSLFRIATQVKELLEDNLFIRKIQVFFFIGTAQWLQIAHIFPFTRS